VKFLVKLGGTLLDAVESRDRLAREIHALALTGHAVTVVHGGGKQMTRFLAERNVESRFVNGLRVTTPEVVDAILKVFAGTVNHELVSSFIRAGVQAVGLSGIDACLVEAVQMDPALGAVGRPVRANTSVLDLLTGGGFLPVVACVAGDAEGRVYNVNADQMAVACAAGWQASTLLFLTDVDGVRGAEGTILPSLTPARAAELIAAGIATGGMHAKLNAAGDALRHGVAQVLIVPGALPNVIERILAGECIGTRMTLSEDTLA
jgi:acetylglutamate kinase